MNFFKKRWYLILFILFVIGFIFTKVNSTQTNGKKQTAYKVKRQNIKETLSLSGTVDAEERATLRFQSSGKLIWVGVKQGDYVKKYQGIASLDQRQLQKTLKKYLLAYQKDRSSFEQTKDDKRTDLVDMSVDLRHKAQRLVDSAQADLESAVLDVELQSLAMEYSYLYTPIEGLVVRLDSPYAGVNITPAQAEFEVINPKTIYFSATADQNDVVKLKQGEESEIVLDAYPDTTLKGKIYMISFVPKTGETGTVYQVKLALNGENTDYRYRFGMTGDANFTMRELTNVLVVPSKYIKTEKKPDGTLEKKYVMKKVNNIQVKTSIETGEELEDKTIITSGLQEGDTVYD